MKVAFSDVLREPLTLTTRDGLALEAELVSPDEPRGAAVLTHPHPRHGGNMRSMIPGELIEALPALGLATLRFNFRGMGASEGSFEDGVGEVLDIAAALDTLMPIVEGLPILIFGSSFGADTALSTADPRLAGWCACAPPLRDEKVPRFNAVARDPRPKRLVVAERDQYRDPSAVRTLTADWANTDIDVISGADHFFIGRTDRVVDACRKFAINVLDA